MNKTKIEKFVNQRKGGPSLAVLIKRTNGVPFEEALQRADDENRIMVSNSRLDEALCFNEWLEVVDGFKCWTGTMTAYRGGLDKKLGEQIEYIDKRSGNRWIFPVPKEHQDKTTAILVAEHPDYYLEIDGKNRVVHVPEDRVGIVPEFPNLSGHYFIDRWHSIPVGRWKDYKNPIGWSCYGQYKNCEKEWNMSGLRFLARKDLGREGGRVGPIGRSCHYSRYSHTDFRSSVDITGSPYDEPGGVIVLAKPGEVF